MARLKNYQTDTPFSFTETWKAYDCGGPLGSFRDAGSVPGYPVVRSYISKRREIAGVSSTNNGKNRPWSNFSYRKVEIGSSNPVVLTKTGIVCFPFPARDPVTTTNLPERNYSMNTRFIASNGTVCEGFDYTPDLTDANNIALNKIVASLKDIRTQWNFAVTLGEARETAAHLAGTARRLANGFLCFRKGDVVGAYKHLAGRKPVPVNRERTHRLLKRRSKEGTLLDDVSSAWMEFSYAWRPLIGDIDSAAKYIAEKRVKQEQSVYDVSRAHKMERTYTVTQSTGSGASQADLKTTAKTVAKVRYTYEVLPKFWRQPSTMDELGFSDPATLIWELLPLSFVVDWFVNVGQVLESLHELKHWSVKRGIKGTKHVNDVQTTLTRSPTTYTFTYPDQKAIWSKMYRDVQSSLPTAVPLMIKVDNPFDLQKGQMASAAVLLRYAFLQQPTFKR